MYGKLFDSMYDGTLYGQWQALVTFQQMIILADADGTVDITPPALAARTGIPLEIIVKGIEVLEAPDPYSRTPGEDGRRIVRLDDHRPWGWHIVNHAKYKSLQDSDSVREGNRIRKREQRLREAEAKSREVTDGHGLSQSVTDGHGSSRHTDTDTNTEEEKKEASPLLSPGKPADCPHQQIIDLYHQQLPQLRRVREWTDARQSLLRNAWKAKPERQNLDWWSRFFAYVGRCPHLMGDNDRNWQADLEWLVRPKNLPKVLEGAYQRSPA